MNKGLEALINIKDSITNDGAILEYTKEYKAIKQDLDRLEKMERVIKILKDELGLYLEKVEFDKRKIFLLMSKLLGMCLINTTEENYDLLKEVFKNKED